MIDERKIIRKLEKRIEDFVKKYPQKCDCESVLVVKEFIQLLEREANFKNQKEE